MTTPHTPVAATQYLAAQPDFNQGRTEIAFVLDNVADWQTLARGVRAGVEVVVLDSRGNGLAQMADYLAQKTPGSVDAIHLLSHGSSGAINLGALTLNDSNLDTHRDTLAHIGSALTADGDWLIYGCNVAEDEGGHFVRVLGALSSSDVAASTDPTGSAQFGGNWSLEAASGEVTATALKFEAYEGALSLVGTQVAVTAAGDPGNVYLSAVSVGASEEVFLDGAQDVIIDQAS